ncbi:hypothetical protein FALBO_5852 [Fusarium albosuccineum]|uniref:Uncharacterized protein n=1 Tax=Fusarium albosuccineum TaxID=1237068 RepID=A0A8H4LFR3_9HYPO|nr:hypothetical protein FALBO_5852 [Fusarium albosuccineum]
MMASERETTSQAVVLVRALSSCLTEPQALNQLRRAPDGFDKAVETLHSSNGTSRAFQARGFWTWLAYFLATSRDNSIEQDLSQLPSPTLQYVITEVSKVGADSSLVTRIQHTFHTSRRAARRRKLFQDNNIKLPDLPSSPACEPPFSSPEPHSPPSPRESSLQSSSPEPNPPKRLRLDPLQQNQDRQIGRSRDIPPNSTGTDVLQQGGVSGIRLARHNDVRELPIFEPIPRYERAYPKAMNLPFVFPHDLCTTIVKKDGRASLMISIPPDPRDCRLVLDISAEEVQYFASGLFGVRIRIRNQQRVAVFENGTTMVILCSMKLEDAHALPWNKTFGDLVAEGVRQSPMRLDEASDGAILSKCLSLEIPGTADCPARLCLMVQPDRLSLIYHQLWQSS